MPLPMRMNPVAIQIKQLNVVATPKDPDFAEPRNGQLKTYNPTITVRGQIVYKAKDKEEGTLTGDPGLAEGHLTFRYSDLQTNGIVLKKGDIVLSVAGVTANYKITEVRPSGHLRGKPNLLMAYFQSNPETNPSLRR